jgi:hypothetical protein
MFRSTFKTFLVLMALTTMAAWAGSVSADIVASFAGPQDFNGTSDSVTLPNVSIGQEGTLNAEFKPDGGTGLHSIWYDADSCGGTNGEYRVYQNGSSIGFALWSSAAGGNAAFGAQAMQGTVAGEWHKVFMSWKQGEATLFQVDNNSLGTYTNAGDLATFTSVTPYHTLGNAAISGTQMGRFFDGEMRNVVISNTYTPEPSACILAFTGMLGLLAYAWRKRR